MHLKSYQQRGRLEEAAFKHLFLYPNGLACPNDVSRGIMQIDLDWVHRQSVPVDHVAVTSLSDQAHPPFIHLHLPIYCKHPPICCCWARLHGALVTGVVTYHLCSLALSAVKALQ